MDTMSAFAMGMATQHRELMVFDWDKAAQLIKDTKPLPPDNVQAGLAGDWEWTGGTIYRSRLEHVVDPQAEAGIRTSVGGFIVVDDYTYLASTWATPQIMIDYETYDCYRMQSEVPDWGSHTKWPNSARRILGLEEISEDKPTEVAHEE